MTGFQAATATAAESPAAFGPLLRRWRTARRLSQFDLAFDADMSARHLSFLETGRSRPSRAATLKLSEALHLPLRERNELLLAAGFAPAYPERQLDAGVMAEAKRALGFMLERQKPYPAIVLDRGWSIVMANDPALTMLGPAVADVASGGPINVLELLLAPQGRALVKNWDAVVTHLLNRLAREASAEPEGDGQARALLHRLLAYPAAKERLAAAPETPRAPMLPLEIDTGGPILKLFTTLATFGTAQDVTLAELRIECYFPADEATRRFFEAKAEP